MDSGVVNVGVWVWKGCVEVEEAMGGYMVIEKLNYKIK